jgi:hypothetical protein
VTIVLKPWKWSDGAPVTSRDFTFVYNLLKYNYLNWIGYAQGFFPADVKQVLTPNAHTVVLDLNRSYNPAFYTDDVLSEIQLIPQHAWDKTSLTGKAGNYDQTKAGSKAVYAFLQKQGGLTSQFATNPLWKVVDGPWTLQTFNSNGYYADVPNKNYSGTDKPIVSKVEYTPFTTDTAELNTLRSGTSIDVGNLPLNDVSQARALEAEGYTVASLPTKRRGGDRAEPVQPDQRPGRERDRDLLRRDEVHVAVDAAGGQDHAVAGQHPPYWSGNLRQTPAAMSGVLIPDLGGARRTRPGRPTHGHGQLTDLSCELCGFAPSADRRPTTVAGGNSLSEIWRLLNLTGTPIVAIARVARAMPPGDRLEWSTRRILARTESRCGAMKRLAWISRNRKTPRRLRCPLCPSLSVRPD